MNREEQIITEEQAKIFMCKIAKVVEDSIIESKADFPSVMYFLLSTFSFIVLESFKSVEDAKFFINSSISSAFKGFSEMNKIEKEKL